MKGLRICVIFIAISITILALPVKPYATDLPVYITLSRIGATSAGPPLPAHPNNMDEEIVYGILHDGVAYISPYSLETHFDLTITYEANYIDIMFNGQTTHISKYNSYYETSNTYSVYASPSSNDTYQFFGYGYTTGPATYYLYNVYYINIDIMKQLGVLLTYKTDSEHYTIYDFRANNATPDDPNNYVVGGPWLSQGYCYKPSGGGNPPWATWVNMVGTQYASQHLANNFTIWEMNDNSLSAYNPDFYSELKISTQLLSAAQQIRTSIQQGSVVVTCAYRTWYYNLTVPGGPGGSRSFHMRGRAFDANNNNNLYNHVITAFATEGQINHGNPLEVYSPAVFGIFFNYLGWRRYPGSICIGDEMEKMPGSNGNTWLHLQVDPSSAQGVAEQYP